MRGCNEIGGLEGTLEDIYNTKVKGRMKRLDGNTVKVGVGMIDEETRCKK